MVFQLGLSWEIVSRACCWFGNGSRYYSMAFEPLIHSNRHFFCSTCQIEWFFSLAKAEKLYRELVVGMGMVLDTIQWLLSH